MRGTRISPCAVQTHYPYGMATGLSQINRVLNQIPKRAEQRQTDQLRDTFVDSGVSAVLQVVDHQALYGRRGTGKTHALRYLGVRVARTR